MISPSKINDLIRVVTGAIDIRSLVRFRTNELLYSQAFSLQVTTPTPTPTATAAPKMETISSRHLTSRWPDLPLELLRTIADFLDPTFGILRLRSICHSWRCLLSPPSLSLHFPLHLPFPSSTSHSHSHSLSLLQHTIYFLSPPSNPSHGFLIKVHTTSNTTPNTFSVLDPLSSSPLSCKPNSSLNLLEYSISLVSKSYAFEQVNVEVPMKKMVVSENFFSNGDFVALGLCYSGKLLIWRIGDENWTEIVSNGRRFDDVISFGGKFYATVGGKGGLVMINSRLKPIDMVYRLMYGCGKCTSLVECDGGLYLVDRIRASHEFGLGLGFGVFKLDEKGRFWDYELNLNGCVFFIGSDTNFAISKNVYEGCIRDCIYFNIEEGEQCENHAVFDMAKGKISLLADSKSFLQIYLPPWCREAL